MELGVRRSDGVEMEIGSSDRRVLEVVPVVWSIWRAFSKDGKISIPKLVI